MQKRYEILENYFLQAKNNFKNSDLNRQFRRRYMEVFKMLDTLGRKFDKEEIQILCYCTLYEMEYSTVMHVKYAVEKCIQIGDYKDARKLVIDFIEMTPHLKNKEQFKREMFDMIEKSRKASDETFHYMTILNMEGLVDKKTLH